MVLWRALQPNFPHKSLTMLQLHQKYWKTLSGPQLLRLIIGVSAMAIAYEGMSQGVMGAVNVAPEYGVSPPPASSAATPLIHVAKLRGFTTATHGLRRRARPRYQAFTAGRHRRHVLRGFTSRRLLGWSSLRQIWTHVSPPHPQAIESLQKHKTNREVYYMQASKVSGWPSSGA